MTQHANPVTSPLSSLPFVGRAAEFEMLQGVLDEGAAGRGGTLIVCGESGVGKTRLVREASQLAERLEWTVATGFAYPVETGVPYAPFSDAMLPVVRKLDASTLAVLTRGASAELAHLLPALSPVSERAAGDLRGDPAEFKARVLWNFTQFLSRLSAKQPLLIVLENLQWADASSLELLHFVARQIGRERIVLLCTYNAAERDQNPTLRTTEKSLVSLGAARVHELSPLTRSAVDQLLTRAFPAEGAVVREFSALLYGWTRGNPFFVEETLKALVESGRLYERDGTWFGWEVEELALPRSVRDAVRTRVGHLSPAARSLADLVAVVGTRASFEALRAVSAMNGPELLAALDELRHADVLSESADGGSVIYDFTHPMIRETLYTELGLARARMLHGVVGEALERFYDERAPEHPGELAFHFVRADLQSLAPKAVKYLAAAGRDALAKYANREAGDYLSAALDIYDRLGERVSGTLDTRLVEDVATARQRLGDYDAALQLWGRARAEAELLANYTRLAAIERRMGLACYYAGRQEDALAHFAAGLAAARVAGDDRAYGKLLVSRGEGLLALGRPDEARSEVEAALAIAERTADVEVLARAHRSLLLLHLWTGNAERARAHGRRAIELASASAQRVLAFTAHRALALLGALTGHPAETAEHLQAGERLADELRSPLLQLWIWEIGIEYRSATGDWDEGLTLGERALAVARAVNQRALLPRLLVWTAFIYLGRGDEERGGAYLDEAWALSGAGGGERVDVHSVVAAHIGRAYRHMVAEEYDEAVRVGEAGLAVADRSGYVVWAVHRLLPVITESCLRAGQLEHAERLARRLRAEAERVGSPLGLAWSDAAEALLPMLGGERERAEPLLRRAVEALEAAPLVYDGARMRRELARLLAESGDREGAVRELRRAHEVFRRLGAGPELSATRDEMRKLGTRPPPRETGPGAVALTGREAEIVGLVARKKTNKEIGKALGISSRTVSTHLSRIFEKTGADSRAALAEYARETVLP